MLTIGTAVILVAGRMAAQIRQVGTLKAVGVTPGQVTCVLLVEYLAVAVLATAVGLAVGSLLAPSLARVTDVLAVYGAQAPPITWPRAATAFAVTTAVVVLATVRPALRGVRRSTLRSLASNTRPPHRPGRLIRAITRLPLPLPVWLGLRGANRRRGRFLANTLGLTVGITLLITALALRTGVDTFRQQGLSIDEPDPISRAADIANQDRASSLGFTVAALLIALALINATVAAVFAAHDHARNHAIMRTIGATPGQTVTAFLVAQLTACLLACALGIPLGIAFYESSIRGRVLDPIGLSALTYVATILAALTLYGPHRRHPRQTPRPTTGHPPTRLRIGLLAPLTGSNRHTGSAARGGRSRPPTPHPLTVDSGAALRTDPGGPNREHRRGRAVTAAFAPGAEDRLRTQGGGS